MSDQAKATDGGDPRRDKLGPIVSSDIYPPYALPGMRDLQRQLRRNAMLRYLWELFLDGSLSFERMLVAAVVLLADQAERLLSEAVARATTIPRGSMVTMPGGVTISPEIKPGDVVAGCPSCGRVIRYPVAGEPVTCECGLTTAVTAEIRQPADAKADEVKPDHVVTAPKRPVDPWQRAEQLRHTANLTPEQRDQLHKVIRQAIAEEVEHRAELAYAARPHPGHNCGCSECAGVRAAVEVFRG
jgi:hypothetical protein